MTAQTLTREMIVRWLQATPDLRTVEVAALADRSMKYLSERLRVMELDGFIVRGAPRRIGRVEFVTWRAADPQPASKRAPGVKVRRKSKRNGVSGRAAQYVEQIIVERPAPNRDVIIVGQALAQLPDLQAAWMGMRG